MKTTESSENYLERILILGKKGLVRSVDIAEEMGISRPSVSVAMKNLRERNFILVDKDGYITLTATGAEIAENMYGRYVEITDWLSALGVDKETAMRDAGQMEHRISDKSFNALKHICGHCSRKAN
jgi:Mn-dependent DtxR family transcriptional regulator